MLVACYPGVQVSIPYRPDAGQSACLYFAPHLAISHTKVVCVLAGYSSAHNGIEARLCGKIGGAMDVDVPATLRNRRDIWNHRLRDSIAVLIRDQCGQWEEHIARGLVRATTKMNMSGMAGTWL